MGADLSGIELRMLAHYLARYDGGRYAKILLEDDIHQVNADRIGISRRAVKTVTYAFLYGAGDQKIGLSYDSQLSARQAKRKGKEIKEAFIDAIDGLGDLLDAIKNAAEKGHIKSIDGRKVLLDSQHKALNYLLQSGAGVVAKRWMVINDQTIKETGICASQLGFIHDELQFETTPEHVNHLQYPYTVSKSWRVLTSESQSLLRHPRETIGEKLTDFEKLAWAGGIFDGEGCLHFSQKEDRWFLQVRMCDLDAVEDFAALWGLKVRKESDPNKAPSVIAIKEFIGSTKERKQLFISRTTARDKVFTIVCDLYPYLCARRREKCDEFLLWYANKTGKRYD